jgi:flagellar basal-body rod protein FlgB
LRGRVIAANLANIATPGYKRIEVAFEESLKQALSPKPLSVQENRPTGETEMPVSPDLEHVVPIAYRPVDLTQPSGLNNVDVDMEMSKLAEAQMAFRLGVRFIQDRKGALESSIKGYPS